MTTSTPMFCEETPDQATTTYCYFPSQAYLDHLDYTYIIPLIFQATIIFFIVAFFVYSLTRK